MARAWIRSIAAASALVATPCGAGDLDSIARDSCQFFVRIPLGATPAKERQPVYGFAVRGRRDYELFVVDSHTLRAMDALGAGIDGKILLVGGVVAAAALVASRSDSSAAQKREEQLQQQAQQQSQQKLPAPCPNTPPTC